MKNIALLTFLFFAVPQAFAQSVEVCPILPTGSGLEWSYSEGPDFDVCRAHTPGSNVLAFGIYLGNHPSFHPDNAARVAEGKVAGRPITWYSQEVEAQGSDLSRQGVLTLNSNTGYVAHIWVAADTEQQLSNRLLVLERIVFKDM